VCVDAGRKNAPGGLSQGISANILCRGFAVPDITTTTSTPYATRRLTMCSLSRPSSRVYGLHLLLTYARTHHHSHQWIGAIATLLMREGRAHG
jgi:hypothetical protein